MKLRVYFAFRRIKRHFHNQIYALQLCITHLLARQATWSAGFLLPLTTAHL